MLDFSRLKADPGAQRGPFEGLVCGLGRRFPPQDGSNFHQIDGAGGDGGLEAYWVTPSDEEIGYQAKFHLSSAEIDWGKIDTSVTAALQSHPRLVRYIIAIACDLTDVVPGRGRAKMAV